MIHSLLNRVQADYGLKTKHKDAAKAIDGQRRRDYPENHFSKACCPMNQDITQLLSAYEDGQKDALNELFPVVYQHLHQIALKQLNKSWSVETISATVLVNESYLKLAGNAGLKFNSRAHFFAVAAKAMRQIILNYAEQKQAEKRGSGWQRVTLEQELIADEHAAETMLSVGHAIDEVEQLDTDLARLIEMKFFAGMTETEIAAVLEQSERTVRRNWKKAKALLIQAMSDD